MRLQFQTENTCARIIYFDLEDNIVSNIEFYGGCNGNLKAISKLMDGKTVEEIEETLTGITCGNKPTSCTDQLAKAVRAAADFVASKKDNQND